MVSSCIVPKCKRSRRKQTSGVSYYRVPVKDPERCRQWLQAVNNPKHGEDAATGSLQNLRVCSLHFKPEDYEHNVLSQTEWYVKCKKLKETAVPSIGLDEEEPGDYSAKPPGTLEQNLRTATSSANAAATLSTAHMSAAGIVAPKDEEESGPSTARPPAATHTGGQLRDTWAVMDRAPGQVRSTGIQVDVPETTEKPTLQYIVDEEAILQLMKNCPMCNRKCRCNKRTCGPYFIVYQSCYFCHYQRKWASQPEARNMNPHKGHTAPKRKLQTKDKVSPSSQLNKTSTSDSSVSESHDPSET